MEECQLVDRRAPDRRGYFTVGEPGMGRFARSSSDSPAQWWAWSFPTTRSRCASHVIAAVTRLQRIEDIADGVATRLQRRFRDEAGLVTTGTGDAARKGGRLSVGQVLVDELDGDGAGADGGCYAFDGSVAHVTDGEDSGEAGLHRQR